MQLDRTNVVIRARSLSEIGDLAMILIRHYPAAAIFGFTAGLMPWAILNALLIGWIPVTQFTLGFYDDEMSAELYRYVFLMITLVILQAPIASVITTVLIGRAVFEQQVTWRKAFAELRQTFWRSFWVLAVVRGPLPLMLILATNWGQEIAVGREILLPIFFLFLVAFQRGRRPFMPEILLLERCPLRAESPAVINARRRSAALHGPLAGELIGRFLTVAMALAVFCLAALYSLLWVRGLMLSWWEWTMVVYLVLVPAALWMAAGLSALIRFLSYLDTRIRLEGWEVDLAVRAETQRQFGESEAPAAPPRDGVSKRRTAVTTVLLLIAMAALQRPAASAAPVAAERAAGIAATAAAPSDRSATEVVVAPPASTTWYDAQTGELRPVSVRTDLPDSKNRDSRWLPRAAKVSAPAAPGPVAAGGTGGGSHVVGWMLLAITAAILVGLMLYVFSKVEPDAWGSPRRAAVAGSEGLDQQTLERMQHLPSEVRRTDVNLRDEAERLMNLGRLEEAIVLLFGHQLLLLDRCGILRLARGKTNGRYLRETRSHSQEAHRLLAPTVAAFEASYFGRHAPQAEQFKQLWADNAVLESLARAQMGIAA